MTILKNVEVRFAQLNPEKPSTKIKKSGRWSIQIFTRSRDQAKEWRDLNIKVKMNEDDSGVFYTANIARNVVKTDGTKAEAPKVVNGNLVGIDPNTIGNGSICNIRIFQYEYTFKNEDGSTVEGIATILMAVQVIKHIVYHRKPGAMEDFEETATETIDPEPMDDSATPDVAF